MTIGISSRRDDEEVRLIGSSFCHEEKSPIRGGGYLIHSLLEMNSYFIAILRKYMFECSYNIVSIIRNRKDTLVGFSFQGYTMTPEPLLAVKR